jgi:hypothetical protein
MTNHYSGILWVVIGYGERKRTHLEQPMSCYLSKVCEKSTHCDWLNNKRCKRFDAAAVRARLCSHQTPALCLLFLWLMVRVPMPMKFCLTGVYLNLPK